MKNETINVKRLKLRYSTGVFLFVITVIIFTSCAVNKYSQSDVNMYLTKKRINAKTSPISFRIPKGWHVVDANNKEFIDLWIVRNDMSVSLGLQPIHFNSDKISLQKSYKESILMQQTKFQNRITIIEEEPIILNNIKTLFYNFSIEGKEFRIALFRFKDKLYELTLFGDNSNIKIEHFIQELVISSAK